MLREFFSKGDKVLLFLCILASLFGLALIYTATRWYEGSSINPDRLMVVQMAATALGIVIYLVLSTIDFRRLLDGGWRFLVIFNIGFLLILRAVGTDNNSGNFNWIEIPFLGIDIQPNEIIKVSYIMLTAYFMGKIQEDDRNISDIPSLIQLGSHALLTIGLIAYICGDWGMCVIYSTVTLIMLWSGGLKLRWFVLLILAVSIPVYILWIYYLPYSDAWDSSYVIMRFRVLFDRNLDPTNVGWQQTRSILALGSGKLFGQGYLRGIQTQSSWSSSLPARHTDFIFSVCGEELGLVGCVMLLVILFSIILRCVWIAHHVDNFFSAYVAMGTAGMILMQVFFNVGMCLYIMPTMGLTLPFISYGGSSVVTMYAAMGIVSSLRSRSLPRWLRDRGQLQF